MENKSGSSAEASAKAGKYFKYAIGEIILVVIGIVIALQLNDWNDNRKQLKQETTYLLKLKEDIQFIKDNMSLEIEQFPQKISQAQQAFLYVQHCNETNDGKEALETILISHGNLGTLFIRETTYSEMLANGAFTRLHSDSLKTSISELYSQLHYANDYITYFRDELGRASTIIWSLIDKEFKPDIELDIMAQDQIRATYNYDELCRSGPFKNALAEVIDARQDVYGISLILDHQIEGTLALLSSEIEKNQ